MKPRMKTQKRMSTRRRLLVTAVACPALAAALPLPAASPQEEANRRLEVEEVALYTVAGGKLHQQWLLSDRMPVAQALGYTVTPPPGSEEGEGGDG